MPENQICQWFTIRNSRHLYQSVPHHENIGRHLGTIACNSRIGQEIQKIGSHCRSKIKHHSCIDQETKEADSWNKERDGERESTCGKCSFTHFVFFLFLLSISTWTLRKCFDCCPFTAALNGGWASFIFFFYFIMG